MTCWPPEALLIGIIEELRGKPGWQDAFETFVFISGPGHDDEVAQQQQLFPLPPGLDGVKGVLTDDEIQFQLLQIFLQEILNGVDRVGFTLLLIFHIGKGEGGISFNSEADHLLTVIEGRDVRLDFMRWF